MAILVAARWNSSSGIAAPMGRKEGVKLVSVSTSSPVVGVETHGSPPPHFDPFLALVHG